MYLKQSWEWPPPFAIQFTHKPWPFPLRIHGRSDWNLHGVGEALVVVVSKVMPAKSKVRELLVVVLPCNSNEGI